MSGAKERGFRGWISLSTAKARAFAGWVVSLVAPHPISMSATTVERWRLAIAKPVRMADTTGPRSLVASTNTRWLVEPSEMARQASPFKPAWSAAVQEAVLSALKKDSWDTDTAAVSRSATTRRPSTLAEPDKSLSSTTRRPR